MTTNWRPTLRRERARYFSTFGRNMRTRMWPNGRPQVTEGPHEFLLDALTSARPSDAVLSEEGADDPVRLSSERVWIIDPLDGTREFSELDRDDWAVHVALWQGGDLVAVRSRCRPRTSPVHARDATASGAAV